MSQRPIRCVALDRVHVKTKVNMFIGSFVPIVISPQIYLFIPLKVHIFIASPLHLLISTSQNISPLLFSSSLSNSLHLPLERGSPLTAHRRHGFAPLGSFILSSLLNVSPIVNLLCVRYVVGGAGHQRRIALQCVQKCVATPVPPSGNIVPHRRTTQAKHIVQRYLATVHMCRNASHGPIYLLFWTQGPATMRIFIIVSLDHGYPSAMHSTVVPR